MRILVTGGSGFIGRHLVQELSAHGHEVSSLDRAVGARIPNVAQWRVDLLDRDAVAGAIAESRPEAVVHLAARTDLDEKRDICGYAANMEGVENLIAAIRATPDVRRVIYTSTQLVCRVGHVPKADDEYLPNTLYGESKVWTEKIVRRERGGGVEWCIVRPTTVWGPGMSGHYQRLFRMISAGRYVHVGRRPLYKSFGYVGNLVHQYRMLLATPASNLVGRTLYLADYEPLSLQRWTDAIQRQLGAPRIKTVPETLARIAAAGGDVVNRLGWNRFPYNTFRLRNVLTEYVFNLRPAADICGPLPYSMEDGISATIAWLRTADILDAGPAASTAAGAPL